MLHTTTAERPRLNLSRRRFLGVAGAGGTAGLLGPTIYDAIDGPGSGASTPKSGGTLNWAIAAAEPTTLDPANNTFNAGGPTNGNIALALYDSLGTYNYKMTTFVPRTAQSITPNSSQTVWTIKLKSGIAFTDGTPYDANAVNAYWTRINNPATASTTAAVLAGWTWTVVDAQTLQVTLPNALGNFLESMSGALGAIPSPTAVGKYGSLYGTSPATTSGAGPFQLASWVHGTALTMNKNPNYWQSGKPYLNTLIITILADEPTKVNAMLTGQIQVGYFSAADAPTIAMQHAGFPVSQHADVSAYGLIFQFSQAPYNDIRVRQALVLATNCVDANLKATAGASPVAGGPTAAFYPKNSPFYDASVKQKSNNIAAAQKLLNAYIAEKGPISGVQQLACPAPTYLVNLGTAVQQQWAKLQGITFQLNVLSAPGAAVAAFGQGKFGVGLSLDPAWYFVQDAYQALYSTSPGNVTHYNNPKMDALITAGRGYQDIPNRKTYMNQMGQVLINDSAYGRIFFEVYSNFAQQNVGNLNTKNNFGTANWPDPTLLYLSST
jgi:peptide/nickel transport system substrate-binding protein